MKKWHYTSLAIKDAPNRQELFRALNNLGDNGWELVAIYDGVAYFKRPAVDALQVDLIGELQDDDQA